MDGNKRSKRKILFKETTNDDDATPRKKRSLAVTIQTFNAYIAVIITSHFLLLTYFSLIITGCIIDDDVSLS